MKTTWVIALLFLVLGVPDWARAEQPNTVSIDWGKTVSVSTLSPSVYVVNSPFMRRNSPIHEPVYRGLKELGVDYLRYMSYFTFPKLSVAELYPPGNGKTSWDFSLLDPLVLDIFKAAEGHPVMMTFNTVPAWMFKRDKPVSYPDDPNAIRSMAEGPQGTELADTSAQQLADYYARLFSWYTQGGFTDEFGKYHKSGHHFDIPYWEVLNEPDLELMISPQNYTKIYDRVVTAIRRIDPQTRFVGLSMGQPTPERLEYFLDPGNHEPGIPLDMISYHSYSVAENPKDGPEQWQYSFFSQANEFIQRIDFIENIRKRLSPSTRTAINETGTLLISLSADPNPPRIPDSYWNLSGAVYAYLYLNLSRRDIDTLHMSHGVGYPGFFPDLSMFDWNTGKPNARYRALQLIRNHLGPGDRVIATDSGMHESFRDFAAQAYRKADGTKKLLLVNKRNRDVRVVLPPSAGGQVHLVDGTTGGNPPKQFALEGDAMTLSPFSVSVVTLR